MPKRQLQKPGERKLSKFTPGPWKWTANNKYLVSFPLDPESAYGERMILENFDDSFEGPLKDANARLISAAPELLESLREAVRLLRVVGAGQINQDHINRIAEPIAKAEGSE